METEKQVILVTNANSCVAQHIIKLLQEKDENVKEIRCLDKEQFQNKLGKLLIQS